LDDIERNADRLNIQAAANQITVPWLIVHGVSDESVPFQEAESLKRAGRRKQIRLLPIEGGTHTFGATHPWRSTTPELDTVFNETLAWFSAHLQ
jgi:fermentation-respiration switch protein FrsA (DUF1100 family)